MPEQLSLDTEVPIRRWLFSRYLLLAEIPPARKFGKAYFWVKWALAIFPRGRTSPVRMAEAAIPSQVERVTHRLEGMGVRRFPPDECTKKTTRKYTLEAPGGIFSTGAGKWQGRRERIALLSVFIPFPFTSRTIHRYFGWEYLLGLNHSAILTRLNDVYK